MENKLPTITLREEVLSEVRNEYESTKAKKKKGWHEELSA
jgi:hypothetical protein